MFKIIAFVVDEGFKFFSSCGGEEAFAYFLSPPERLTLVQLNRYSI